MAQTQACLALAYRDLSVCCISAADQQLMSLKKRVSSHDPGLSSQVTSEQASRSQRETWRPRTHKHDYWRVSGRLNSVGLSMGSLHHLS